jgi:hypothetical protein
VIGAFLRENQVLRLELYYLIFGLQGQAVPVDSVTQVVEIFDVNVKLRGFEMSQWCVDSIVSGCSVLEAGEVVPLSKNALF